jgi:uncharacterized protein (DUF983 family)
MHVTRGKIVIRGLTNCCPNCGAQALFKEGTLFALNRACPRCGLRLERDEGFFLGSMSLNYGVTIVGFLVPVLLLYLAQAIAGRTAAILAVIGALCVPMLFYRASRSWWLMSYYLFFPHHLPANQGAPAACEDENT